MTLWNLARDHLDYPDEDWEDVMRSEETKLKHFSINATRHFVRDTNIQLYLKNPRPTVKHGRGNIMVWCKRGQENFPN